MRLGISVPGEPGPCWPSQLLTAADLSMIESEVGDGAASGAGSSGCASRETWAI